MAEPTSTVAATGISLVTLATALFGPALGPLVGPYVVILLCSTVGAQWAILASPAMTRTQAAFLMLRVAGTAVVLTAMLAQTVAAYFSVGINEAYGAISFLIGAMGHKWTEIIEAAKNRIVAFVSRTGGQP